MKIKQLLLSLLFVMSLFSSCISDILDKNPLDIYGDKDLWTSEKLVDAYLVNLYGSTRFGGVLDDNESLSLITTTDEAVNGLPHSSTHEINRGVINADNGFNGYWDYGLIRKLNFFIQNYEQSVLPQEFLKKRVAEVRFLRAFTYFELVKRYGGVPLILRVQHQNENEALFLPRNTEREIYDFIIADSQLAANSLPEECTGTEAGHASKYAALSLLSRAALYAGSIAENGSPIVDPNGCIGIPIDEAKTYYELSLKASEDIIGSKKFELYEKEIKKDDNYQKLFLDSEKNSEVIFWKKYVPKLAGHSYDWNQTKQKVTMAISAEMVNSYEMIDGSDKNIDFEHAEGSLVDLLAKKDPRLHASVLFNGAIWRKIPINSYRGLIDLIDGKLVTMTDSHKTYKGMSEQGIDFCDNLATGFSIKKYLDPENSIPIKENSATDCALFRYAEILLNKAEAAFKLEKKEIAVSAINEVRLRAGILPLNINDISMEKIMNERKIELAFEEHRYYDIRRWRIAEAVIAIDLHTAFAYFDFTRNNYTYQSVAAGNELGKRKFMKKHYYLPITSGRISNNPKLTENPGYN